MKKSFKKVLCVVLALALVFAVAACGTSTPSAGASTSAPAAKDASAATTAAKPSGEKIQLSVMDFNTPEEAQRQVPSAEYNKAINDLQKENPNLDLKREAMAHDVYETKIKTLSAANELPDVFYALPSFAKTFYDNGQLMDIKPVLDANPDWSGSFANGAFGDMTFGDNILGCPQSSIANHVILWNKDIFKKCGIDKFPENADEFKAAVKTLKSKGYTPLVSGNKDKYLISSQVMPGILFKFASADWYKNLKAHKAKFTDPEPLAAITYLDELMKMGLFNEDVNSIDPIKARTIYLDEKAAMYLEGSWVVSVFIGTEGKKDVLNKTGIAIFPQVANKPELADQIVGGQGWGICFSSKLKGDSLNMAVNLLKKITSPESQGKLVESGNLPVVKNPKYDASKLDPFYKSFLDMYNQHKTIVGCPEVQIPGEYMDTSYTGYQELSIGSITPKQLAEKLQAAVDKVK